MQDHGKCPVTKEELSMDDIVLVKTNKVRLLWCANKLLKQQFPVACMVCSSQFMSRKVACDIFEQVGVEIL